MKRIVYLYGGPATGKSTTAAQLFAEAKKIGINAELVREYIKDWMWEDREIKPGDQTYIAAKQSRKERICFNDVDLIVSDSPMYLGQFYEEKYDKTPHVVRHIIKKHEQIAREHGFEFLHIFLNRSPGFNPLGRAHSEEESIQIDGEIRSMLDDHGINYHVMDTNSAADQILSIIK